MDQAFSTLYLGTEYWSSEICSVFVEGEQEGMAYADTPGGLAQLAAYVEGARTEGAINENGKPEYIYRFEISIRNGDYEKDTNAIDPMEFTVQLRGEKTIDLFKGKQSIKRGDRFKKVGSSSIVKQSTTYYSQICILFDEAPYKWRISGNELCNTIVLNAGGASGFASSPSASTSSAGSSSSTSSGETNDI